MPSTRRIGGTLVVALMSTLLFGSSAAQAAAEEPSAACIREGLAPIPVSLRATAARAGKAGEPELVIRWSGRPLAAGCEARRTVAFQATAWYPHLRFSFTEGFEVSWLEFWNGRKVARHEEERQVSNASYNQLGCVLKARGRLRYEVVGHDGEVFGRRVVAVPVKHPRCSE